MGKDIQNEIEEEEFESNNLQECWNFYKETKDCEPIDNAIVYNERKIKATIEKLIELKIKARDADNVHFHTEISRLIDNLTREI